MPIEIASRPNVTRRDFLRTLGAGLMVAVGAESAEAQTVPSTRPTTRPHQEPAKISTRVHVGEDGTITVMTGKVECGQGARAEIALAAAEELRVAPDQIQLIMGDTTLCPDDGGTYGSQTTPRSIPAIRAGCAAARQALIAVACQKLNAKPGDVQINNGKIAYAAGGQEFSYGQLVGESLTLAFSQPLGQVQVSAVKEWKVLGTPYLRPDRRDLVNGQHLYPTDVVRPGMLYGKVLRPPSYGAKLTSINPAVIQGMDEVRLVREGDFIAVAAPNSFRAQQAIDALGRSAQWQEVPQISSRQLYDHLKENAQGGIPQNSFADDMANAPIALHQEYHVAYIQHAPLEPRMATAEWPADGKLTVWTGTQNPFGVRMELAHDFKISADSVRVIVPDFGGAFGGKHQGDPAVEAARIARHVHKPVHLRWSREEEFTWAYFRPAAVIFADASLTHSNTLSAWSFVNINSGPQGIDTPYSVDQHQSQFVPSVPPLRQGSYRALASTANNFARECFMDELAAAARMDPLRFRMLNLDNGRLRNVLQTAADKFGWNNEDAKKLPNTGIGLACGTEKGSFLAACVAITVDEKTGVITVNRVTQAFDCGPIHNPAGLMSQVQGAIMMGIGAALREEIKFENGRIINSNFADYDPPRFADLPQIDVELIDNRDAPPAGAGETPIIAIAPAIANAVYDATGKRIRRMPIKLEAM